MLKARMLNVVVGLALGLVLAEMMVAAADDHAFPYLNIFRSDSRFGVSLLQNEETRIKSANGLVTTVRTNAQGFRKHTNPTKHGRQSILLLGDSQMFGYNVEQEDTVAHHLANLRSWNVINTATPSWGPSEYEEIAGLQIPKHRPQFVVYVANVANDWFEARSTNAQRVFAEHGWLRTRGSRTSSWKAVPGFATAKQHSHLFFKLSVLGSRVSGAAPPRASGVDRLIRELPQLLESEDVFASPLTESLLKVDTLCREYGCKTIAITLPLDVQVYHGEWSKYRVSPRVLKATEQLAKDFINDAQAHGIESLDLMQTLRRASPGAFLPDDYHLSPKGHHAVANAMANAINPTISTSGHHE